MRRMISRKTLTGALMVALALGVTTLTVQADHHKQKKQESKASDKAKEKKKDELVGNPAPNFELTDLEGNTYKLSDFRGQVVVLHFQSRTCPWDRAYQDDLNEWARRFMPEEKDMYASDEESATGSDDAAANGEGEAASDGVNGESESESASAGDEPPKVQFLGLNPNHTESVESLKEYHKERQIPYPILKDVDNEIADKYKARTTPHIYIIDAEGVLRYMGGVEQPPVSVKKVADMDDQYLVPTLEALLAGKEELPYTKTISKGCGIKRVPKQEKGDKES